MVEKFPVSFIEIDDPQWIDFVQSCSGSNIFHSPAWSRLLADTYGLKPKVIAILDQENNIMSALPFLEKRPIFGKKEWISLPFSDHCEVLAVKEDAKVRLVEALAQQPETLNLNEIEVRSDLAIPNWKQISNKNVIHLLELKEEPDLVWKDMHSMHRRNIRTAMKHDLKMEMGNSISHVKKFYKLHLDSRRRMGVPIQPWGFFKNMARLLIERHLGFVILIYEEEECVAGAVFLFWGNTMTYKYGASLRKSQASRANNLLMWQAIEWGCENGYQMLDLGRTSIDNHGLRSYKSRWGAKEYPLVYTTSLMSTSNSVSERGLELASPVIQMLPKWFTRVSGEILYRLFK